MVIKLIDGSTLDVVFYCNHCSFPYSGGTGYLILDTEPKDFGIKQSRVYHNINTPIIELDICPACGETKIEELVEELDELKKLVDVASTKRLKAVKKLLDKIIPVLQERGVTPLLTKVFNFSKFLLKKGIK